MLTLALSKGRILEDTAGLLAQCGIRLDSSAVDSRQLILPTDDPGLPTCSMARPTWALPGVT